MLFEAYSELLSHLVHIEPQFSGRALQVVEQRARLLSGLPGSVFATFLLFFYLFFIFFILILHNSRTICALHELKLLHIVVAGFSTINLFFFRAILKKSIGCQRATLLVANMVNRDGKQFTQLGNCLFGEMLVGNAEQHEVFVFERRKLVLHRVTLLSLRQQVVHLQVLRLVVDERLHEPIVRNQ